MLLNAENVRNKWEYVSKLPQAVCAHAGASLDGNLYISGGFATDGFQKGVYCYSPDEDKWEPRRNLNSERGLHCMVGFKVRFKTLNDSIKHRDSGAFVRNWREQQNRRLQERHSAD